MTNHARRGSLHTLDAAVTMYGRMHRWLRLLPLANGPASGQAHRPWVCVERGHSLAWGTPLGDLAGRQNRPRMVLGLGQPQRIYPSRSHAFHVSLRYSNPPSAPFLFLSATGVLLVTVLHTSEKLHV